jgi:inner membrane transporter RhtA
VAPAALWHPCPATGILSHRPTASPESPVPRAGQIIRIDPPAQAGKGTAAVEHVTAPRRGAGAAVMIVISVGLLFQVGSALGVRVIESVGVVEALWLRTALAALMLIAVRPRSLRFPARGQRTGVLALTFALLGMNFFFYQAISRVPLGIVVTIEFLGPLAVAVLGSRRLIDWLWIVLAGCGVALLAGPSGSAEPVGLAFAFAAAACWGAFLLLAKQAVTHLDPLGVTIQMLVGSALLLTPLLLVTGVAIEGHGNYLALGALVALLSSAIPYHLELLALQRVPASTYGVLLSIEPAIAALAGFVMLSQQLNTAEVVAIIAVAVAAGGASWTTGRAP